MNRPRAGDDPARGLINRRPYRTCPDLANLHRVLDRPALEERLAVALVQPRGSDGFLHLHGRILEIRYLGALNAFRGPIRQRVPPFSAVKQGGRPLYKQARRGETFELPEREVTIHALDLLSYEPPDLALRVAASSGTYIRSLAHDLGETLGTGGHITALRRTAVGAFTLAQAVALDALTPDSIAEHLLPSEAAVAHLPRATFDETQAAQLGNGLRLLAPEDALPGDTAAFGPGGRFLGVVVAEAGQWRPRKMILEGGE